MWLAIRSLIWFLVCPGMVAFVIPLFYLTVPLQLIFEFDNLRHNIALLVVITGISILLHSIYLMAILGKGTLSPVDPAVKLVCRGLYSKSRNPMYLGVLIILLGESIYFWSTYLLFYSLAVAVLFHLFVVFYEEPWLKKKFGREYEGYCKRARRWL